MRCVKVKSSNVWHETSLVYFGITYHLQSYGKHFLTFNIFTVIFYEGGIYSMSSKRTAAFIILYIGIIGMILFTYFYVQKYYSHEATHLRLDQSNSTAYHFFIS